MRLLYALPIVLMPNALHLPPDVAMGTSTALLFAAAVFGPRDRPGLMRTGYLTAPFIGMLLAVLLGYITAQWGDVSNASADLADAKYAIIYPLLYVAYRRCGLDLKATRQLIVLLLAVAAVAGVEAVVQALQFNLAEYTGDQRATGPFGEIDAANRAGVFFAIFLPMLVAFALQPNLGTLARWLAAAGGVILIAAILFTFSRQSYLIALFGILLLLAYRLVNRGVPVAALVVLLMVVVASVGLLPESVVQRVEGTRQVGAGGTVLYDGSTESRIEIWEGAVAMVADRPAGVGLGRFRKYIGNYSNYPNTDAHNSFILVLAECGVFGLAMMLWLFWRLWGLTRKLRRTIGPDLPEARAFALGFTVAVASMTLGNLYGSAFVSGLVMYNFWILCGLVERYGMLLATEGSSPHQAAGLETRFPLTARALPGLGADSRPVSSE